MTTNYRRTERRRFPPLYKVGGGGIRPIKFHHQKSHNGHSVSPEGRDLTPKNKVLRPLWNLHDCVGCGGNPHSDLPDAMVLFKGFNYKAPFFCFCCGIQICAAQFAWGRTCGYCDTGACQRPTGVGL